MVVLEIRKNNLKFNLPDDFSSNEYRICNDDLQNLNDDELRIHYLDSGILDRRKYKIDDLLPDDFDSYNYRFLNRDINFDNINEKIHYLKIGEKNGRKYRLDDCLPNNFNVDIYRTHKDLKNLSENELKRHYLQYGINENRYYNYSQLFPTNFDLQEYISIYPQLKNMDEVDAKIYYLKNHKITKHPYRIQDVLPSDFNWKDYTKIYDDLKNMNKREAEIHYIHYGRSEKRVYDINYLFKKKFMSKYKKLKDKGIILKKATMMMYINKYLNKNDKKFKLKLPEDFDVNIYRKLYDDLNSFGSEELKSHYLNYGFYEGRKYRVEDLLPSDFNWINYRELYKDLFNKNKDELELHFVQYGRFEGRVYDIDKKLPSDFNWEDYSAIYDLGKNERAVKLYYIHYRFPNNLRYKLDDFLPDSFQVDSYRELNMDLRKFNNRDLKLHYIKIGKNESRIINKPFYITNFFDWKKYKKDLSIINNNINYKSDNLFELFTKLSDNRDFDYKLSTINNYDLICKNDFSNNSIYYSKLNCDDIYHPNNININNKISIDEIDNFILTLNFCTYSGGGTSFFLDCILSKYKNYQTFLVIRKIDSLVIATVNDEKFLGSFTEIEFFNLMLNNIYKINKIFVNHFLGFSNEFLKLIKKLDKELTFITHDYLSINRKPQDYYHNLLKEENYNYDLDINIFDRIIIQNEVNLYIFGKFLEKNKNVVIVPLPDFKKSLKRINTSNSNIVIGIIGLITIIKGGFLLNYLINYFKKNYGESIKFVVFGNTYYYHEHKSIYNSLIHFNELLINFKPNMIIDLSLWPETYSYTLTLAMCTQLPIICLKKNYNSVIENRLKDYKKFEFFTNIDELCNIIFKIKQDYFYTVEPLIYYNEWWDGYFIDKKRY